MSEVTRKIVIESRFSGPPGLGNGGYVAGVLGRAAGGEARVTLRAPIPLDTPLDLVVSEAGAARRAPRTGGGVGAGPQGGPAEACRVELRHGETLLAEAAPAVLDLAPPPAPDRAAAIAATGRYPGRTPNPYRECFVCGFAREPGSGLRVFAGPTGTPGLVAADWTVHPGLADEDGVVPEEFLWGALDCPGAYAVGGAEPRNLRLGRMTARVSGRVRPGERCTVAGWRIGSERRKHFTGTAVYGEAGNVAALAAATWIAPREEGTRSRTMAFAAVGGDG